MREFFRGWKRKVGCVTLLLACVFTAGWLRSRFVTDHITLTTKAYPLITITNRLSILEASWFDDKLKLTFHRRWTVTPITAQSKPSPNSKLFFWWDTPPLSTGGREIHRGDSFAIRYFVIVIPLTLLSAFLLLSKPRPSNQKTTVDVVSENDETQHGNRLDPEITTVKATEASNHEKGNR
jgi:hypothetical protein